MRDHIRTNSFGKSDAAVAGAICLAVLFWTTRDSIAAMITPTGEITARQSYQDGREKACNTSPTTCIINFAQIAAGKRLEIRCVTCQVGMAQEGTKVADAALMTSDDTNDIVLRLGSLWERTVPVTDGLAYNWSQPVQMFVPGGRRASVIVGASGALFMSCTISGEMLTVQ
jgi:hypothetical protein